MGAADLQADFLQNPGHAVAHGGGGSQAQVHNSKGYPQTAGGFHAHQLTHPGNLESGFLDGFRNHIKGLSFHLLQRMVHHAGTGHAHIQDALRLAHAVKRSRHERVILNGIAEYNKLCTGKALCVGGKLRRFLYNLTHLLNSVHVYTGSR